MERMTRQRKIIMEELKKTKKHPDASEVYLSVKKKIPNVSFGTIYRNLEIMSREGKIMKIVCDGFNRFDGNPKSHNHFYCDRCQRVYDIEYPIKLNFNKKDFEKKTGFKIFRNDLEIRGLCRKCRRL